MGNTFFFNWEIPFMLFLQSFESGLTTALATLFTLLCDENVLILTLGLIYWSIDKRLGRKMALITCGSAIFGSLLKGLVLRRRPYMDNPEVKCIRAAHPDEDISSPVLQGYSMPSLHSTVSVSLFGGIARYAQKSWTLILAFVLPLFIGLSRPYLGVHYPTDVLSGWALGLLSLFILSPIVDKRDYKFAFTVLLFVGAIGFIYCRDGEFFKLYGVVLGMTLGFIYEEKYICFDKPGSLWFTVLRPLVGFLLFVTIKTALKLPVRNVDADEHSMFLLFYRLLRFSLATFVIIGPYTKLFKIIEGKKQKGES